MNIKIAEALVTLQNSKQSQIPLFSYQIIEQAKLELKKLNQDIKILTAISKQHHPQKTAQQHAFQKAKIALLFDQVYRIKRFLLNYFNFRCDRVEDQFWSYGGDLKNTEKSHLSEQEKNYFNNYKSMVMDYVEDVGVDLTIDLQPPLELEDCGQILDQFGQTIKLQKNSCGFMKKRLIQRYVKQGFATIKKK